MFVNEFFGLRDSTVDMLQDMKPNFGYNGFGEFVFYRTYSRIKENGLNETWSDVVIRNIEGVMSIRKDWYIKNRIEWKERWWQDYAANMAAMMFDMKWLPPGRGLWAMGTPFIYQNGGMSLYNCAFTQIKSDYTMADDYAWMMDCLMLGVGVGFEPLDEPFEVHNPNGTFIYIIPDSREGWVNALRLLIDSYIRNTKKPVFDFSHIRERGLPIKGFGGVASGPEPLKLLLSQIETLFEAYLEGHISSVRLKTDIGNLIGVCVVAGNVRRSAEIAIGSIRNEEFLDLKNYKLYPERESFGWMSNNTAKFTEKEDFDLIGDLAGRVIHIGEPGGLNMRNMKYGRIGKFDNVREDQAVGLNPLTLAA